MKRRNILKLAALGAAATLGLGATAWKGANAQGGAITADNWGESVGFKPDLSAVKVQPGTVIHKGNVDSVKGLLPAGLESLVRKYEMKINVKAYEPYHPAVSYIKATNDNIGKSKCWDVKGDFRK